jgi:Ca2+-binding EF-hand superfamily protein
MSRKTLLIAAGVLAATGGLAVAVAQIGQREDSARERQTMGEWRDGHHMRGDRDRRGPRHGAFRRGGDRTLTQEEFDTRTRERFARFDANSDGVIDATEVEAVLKGRGERFARMGEFRQKRILSRWDGDRDGKATKDEFLATVKRRFAAFDLNGDGRITDEDLPPTMRGRGVLKGDDGIAPQFGGRMQRRGAGMMGDLRGADANKDGIVTLDEVVAGAAPSFDALDRNKDGSVDQADFDALRGEMTAYRAQRFLHRFGAVQDGKVTREQFHKVAKERFAARDVNNDGKLDRSDFWPGMPGRRHLR